MSASRVLIAGGRHVISYAHLRAVLDKLLANRLPDVELLTTGGVSAHGFSTCASAT